MASGTDTYMGLAVPLNGDFSITGRTAATDTVTIASPLSATGVPLNITTSTGTRRFAVTAAGTLLMRVFTTRPTTGLTKGELMVLIHTSTPKIGICYSTAVNGIKLIRLKTKSFGRLTA
jgi:hypothetical protein